jgi:hypothetical protein
MALEHQVKVRLDTETFERALAEANAQERSVSFIIRRALKQALERAEKGKADFESAQRAVKQVLQTSSDEATKGLRSFAKATSAARTPASLRRRVVPTLGHLPVGMITAGLVDRAIDPWETEFDGAAGRTTGAPPSG